jgi:ABC-type multidrug transport system permease subunit
VDSLTIAIEGLNALKGSGSGTCCDIAEGAIDLNILSLDALRSSTNSQIVQADGQIAELEELNVTLQGMREKLENYTLVVAQARNRSTGSGEILEALDEAEETLDSMGALFEEANEDVGELRALLGNVGEAMEEMEETLDEALEQAGSVDGLIGSLQETVGEQTGKNPENIAIPLSVDAQNHYKRGSFVDFIMPQVIAVSLLLSCFLLSSMSLVREKTRKTIVRSLLVPGALGNLVAGKIISVVLISFAQVLMILVVAAIVFGVIFPYDLIMLGAGTAVSALVLSSIGMLVGFFSRNESSAIQGCLVLAIPMMFLGNVIFSPDLLPAYTQILQDILPLSHVTNIFKIVLITNGNPVADMAALIAYFVVLAALIWAVLWKRREITAYS